MKKSITATLYVVSFTILPCLSFCQDIKKEISNISGLLFDKDGPGGTVLAVKGDSVIYRDAFGKANIELDVKMKPGDDFRIGSITKQFTACAILKLAEEGKLSLQNSITKFIPDYPTQGYSITIEHLLTHTSGIKNYTGIPKLDVNMKRIDISPKELIDFFKNEPLDFEPGTQFRYSNSGYILLGYIIEKVSGKAYGEYIADNFFKVLGMEHSFYDDPSAIINGRVNGYKKFNGTYKNADFLSMTLPYAAGSLVTNIDDLYKWYRSLINYTIVSKKSVQQAFTSYKLSNGKQTGYGFGWEVGNIQGAYAVKHVGRINGFVTFALFLPREKILVFIFSNCDCTDNLDNPASKIAAILLDKPYQFASIHLPEQQLRAFAGIYKSSNGDEKTIRYENGRLVYFSKGGFKDELLPVTDTKLLLKNSLTTFTFDSTTKEGIKTFRVQSTGLTETWYRTDKEVEIRNVVNLSADSLQKFVGKYQFSPTIIFSVVTEGNKIYGQVGDDKKQLLAFSTNHFFAKDIDATIIFNTDEQNKVLSLIKIQSDEMTAKKIE